jgi:hypothetical protein
VLAGLPAGFLEGLGCQDVGLAGLLIAGDTDDRPLELLAARGVWCVCLPEPAGNGRIE